MSILYGAQQDVGGFIGDSAIVLSNYTDRKVYCFEPVKSNYQIMLETIKLNQSDNIIPIQMGLGSQHEELSISQSGSMSAINTNHCSTSESIKITTLDEYVKKEKLDVGLIKVDIEGYEQEFLKGAKNTIITQRPALILSIYHNGYDFFQIKPLLESWNLGYTFKIVKPIDGSILSETLLLAECLGE